MFKDNLSFLTVPLAKLPKTMGLEIEEGKGFFPYKFPFPGTHHCRIPLPDKHYFCVETMSKERREEFETWYAGEIAQNKLFDYFRAITSYCSQDVRILCLAAMEFRKVVIKIGKIDPYERCLTLAHLCSVVFHKSFLPSNTLAIIPHDGFKHAKRYSVKAIKYFEFLMAQKKSPFIQHQLNGGEKIVLNKYHVDGFVKGNDGSPDVIYEFAGCFFHGHPCKYLPESKSEFHGCTFGELHSAFVDKVQTFIEAGFNVKIMWECEYEKQLAQDPEFKEFIDSFNVPEPLRPRDALFGGRNEVFSLFQKAAANESIQYVDFCSLYPAVMSTEEYPL